MIVGFSRVGLMKTADSGIIIFSYLGRACRPLPLRPRSYSPPSFETFFVSFDPLARARLHARARAAYQLRDNYSDGIGAYLTLIGCPRAAKIFKQPPELIPRARVTECTETINIGDDEMGIIGRWWRGWRGSGNGAVRYRRV